MPVSLGVKTLVDAGLGGSPQTVANPLGGDDPIFGRHTVRSSGAHHTKEAPGGDFLIGVGEMCDGDADLAIVLGLRLHRRPQDQMPALGPHRAPDWPRSCPATSRTRRRRPSPIADRAGRTDRSHGSSGRRVRTPERRAPRPGPQRPARPESCRPRTAEYIFDADLRAPSLLLIAAAQVKERVASGLHLVAHLGDIVLGGHELPFQGIAPRAELLR
jgi:hypothetical protein